MICYVLSVAHQGVVTATCSLLQELAQINPVGFADCVPLAVTRLSRVSGGGGREGGGARFIRDLLLGAGGGVGTLRFGSC